MLWRAAVHFLSGFVVIGTCCIATGLAEQASESAAHGRRKTPELKRTKDVSRSLRSRGVINPWDKRQLGDREYLIQLPDDWEEQPHGRSLLVLLHGFHESPYSMIRNFEALLSVKEGGPPGPILVAPMGTSDWGMPMSWNTRGSHLSSGPDGPLCSNDTASLGCGSKLCGTTRVCHDCVTWYECAPQCVLSTCADDFQFMADLLDEVEDKYDVDPQKVFLSGFSQGGILTWDIAAHSNLGKRFTAVAPLHGSPQAGFATMPATPTTGPWLLGLWGGASTDIMDPLMPPFSNFPGRTDKARSFNVESDGAWYYNTAENATTTYASGLECPKVGVNLTNVLALPDLKVAGLKCWDEGCNGAVIRCTWPTGKHMIADFASTLVWQYFLLAQQARYG